MKTAYSNRQSIESAIAQNEIDSSTTGVMIAVDGTEMPLVQGC